jgi:hypothetical protein
MAKRKGTKGQTTMANIFHMKDKREIEKANYYSAGTV